MPIEPTIVHLPAFTVVGIGITTSPLAREIPALWNVFGPRIDEVDAIAEPGVSYGLMENFDAAQCTLDYMAAVPVTNTEHIPGGMLAKSMEPGTYAVFQATLSTIAKVFGVIFHEWLPGAAFEQARGPYFERYDEAFDPGDSNSRVEIYLPVRPRSTATV